MPAGGRYSAGRIFLQVVPSFKGVQRETRREVDKINKSMGESMEKQAETSGRRSGKKAGAEFLMGFSEGTLQEEAKARMAWGKFLGNIEKAKKAEADRSRAAAQKVIADTYAMRRAERQKADREEARAERAKQKEFSRMWAAANAENLRRDKSAAKERERQRQREAAAALAEERRAQKELLRANNLAAKERAREALRAAKENQRILAEHHKAVEKAEREHLARRGGAARVEIDKTVAAIDKALGSADLSTKVGQDLDRIQRKAKETSAAINGGLIDTTTGRRQLESLGRDMERILKKSKGGMDVSTRGNMRQAIREIDDMSNALDRAAGKGSRLGKWLKGATGDGEDGANAFRIFNYRILAVAAGLPLLIPLLAVASAGIVALGTAALGAASGLGVMVLGFSGVGDAVKAMGNVADNAAKDTLAASKTMRNAARGVRDAQQALTRARSEAARSAEDSSRRIADAERKVADSQKDATKAQNDLREARKAAQQEQQDLADKIAAGKLDERQALIDLFNAQVDYNAVMASGGSTNLEKEQSSINLERARLAIKEIRKENAGLIADQKKGAAAGPNGDPQVVQAQERVAESTRAQQDAVRDLADARRDADQQAVDSQLAIRDAQERLGDAQASYQEALTKTGDIGSANVDKLNQAMAKLSPAGREFARYLFSLRQGFYDIRDAAQEGMLPGVQDAMQQIIGTYGPEFKDFVSVMATQMGGFFRDLGDMLTSPTFKSFFKTMANLAPQFSKDAGDTFINFLTGVVALMDAFAPYAKDVSTALVGISKGFADWAKSLKGSEGFESFMGYIEKTGPKVWDLLKAVVGAFVALGVALAPIADKLLDFAIGFFEWIANMDPETLSALVTFVLGFVLASQLAAGATQLLITVMTPFHSILGLVVFALIGLGIAFVWLYEHSETFHDIINSIVDFISQHKGVFIALAGIITTLGVGFFGVFNVLKMIYGPLRALQIMFGAMRVAMLAITGPVGLIIIGVIALVAGLIWAYKNVDWFRNGVNAAFSFIGKAISFWWNNYAKPILGFFWKILKDVGAVIWWFWTGVVGPVFELMRAIFSLWWNVWVKPKIEAVGGAFSWLGDKIGEVWRDHIEPWLDKFGLGADDLKRAWDTAISGIGKAWDGLKALVYKPIEFIVNTVINKGFVDNFNKLADVFGTSKIPHLVLPSMQPSKAKAPDKVNGSRVNKGQFYTGGYTGPGAKYQPAGVVHADEYVIRKESTNKIRSKYGLEVLDYLNAYGDLPGMGGYATGGLVAFGRKLQELGFNVGEHPSFGGVHPVHSKNSWHYRKGAVDVNYDGHGQGFETAKINSILGLAKQYGLRTIWQYPGHFDHAHFDVGTGADLGNFSGKASSNPGQGLPWYLDKPIDFIRKAINGFTSKFDIDGVIGDFVTKVPLKVLDFAAEKIQNIISGGNGDFDSDKGASKNNPMYGVTQWRSLVVQALQRVGESTSLADVVLRRMNQESSGDPKAINLWDANAKAGTPSKGLMQVIDPTFQRFRDKSLPNDIWNPMANVVASMKYAKSTYGSLSAAYNRSGGYAEGGLVTEGGSGLQDNGTMMYDSGGYLPPGITQVVNLTGRPEPVFTADQFEGMQGRGGRTALIDHLDIDLHGSDVTAGDVASEIMWAVARVEHGGKYAGKAG